ncbi:MAG: S41 family peptidase [Bacteroidales bacterium]|jgi:carboxyl-terminal processing protease|nr:S41 family peptidase [Bacteroidales bacterium]MDD2688167.1 S41 family peptidase [Bacteroidales bacterium]MDD3330882.1 S41 family peptidase [Bacteroidales bacterium]MDD3691100.1 S41 family peptidase [Bacteroidales bacterium]MDD4044541.1 S41 family peptidase [Bacteroidales bacterium]
MKGKKRNILIVISFVLLTSLTIGFVRNDFEIAKNLDIYATLLRQLNENYVDDINVTNLVEESIHAMLNKLDPYTVFYPESQMEELKLMTAGHYGGIGATILQTEDYVVISEPYEGTPAYKTGLQAGDKIVKVNNQDVKNKSVSDVSALLRGHPGTSVKLDIIPYGRKSIVSKNVVREEIKFPNVAYASKVGDDIGYIYLTQFMENASLDVKNAFLSLKEEGIKSLILDLRGNGGGLLHEAVNIVNLFVDKGELIVSTKGKLSDKNQFYYTQNEVLDANIPLVVLVDGFSASASEIVAGAIQDLDRGVVIGRRTFGKGLVQNVLPLSYNTNLKVTVSKYYIPSGRCIQKVDYSDRDSNGLSKSKIDSNAVAFKTKNGRTVYDYGGVEPDVVIKPETYSTILLAMLEKRIIFNYANEFKFNNNKIPPVENFVFTDQMYEDFLSYAVNQNIEYETYTERQIANLEQSVKDDKFSEAVNKEINQLKELVKKEKSKDLERYKKEIKELLYLEIVSRYYYQKGRLQASLQIDPEMIKAKDLLHNLHEYTALLKGKTKK